MHFSDIALAAGLLQAASCAVLPKRETTSPSNAALYSQLTPEQQATPVQCAQHLQIIAARGSTQPQSWDDGEGSLGGLVDKIQSMIPGTKATGLVYRASLNDYSDSEGKGHKNMTEYIKFFTAKCPNTKLALLGYSQGAQVTMDALCGSTTGKAQNGVYFPDSKPLSEKWQKNIQSVILWGDPSKTFSENSKWNFGTSERDGEFHRENKYCLPYRDLIASFCDSGDPYCDQGYDGSVHTSYNYRYTQKSAQWVKDKYYSNAEAYARFHGESDEFYDPDTPYDTSS